VILFFSAVLNADLMPAKTLSLEEPHFVRCLTHISKLYFASGRSLVISSPSAYRDVQQEQELIAEIHRTAVWPIVVIVDGNINITDRKEFINRNGSYIIIIPDGDMTRFLVEINGLALVRN
jgi:hypothetical protein